MEGAMSGRQLMRCVHRGVLCVAVAGLLVSAAISSLVTDWATPPTRKQVASVLLRVGMHPETLAAAGATPGELAAVFASAEEYLDSRYEDLERLDAEHGVAAAEYARIEKQVSDGRFDGDGEAELRAIAARRDAARSSVEAMLSSTADRGLARLDPETRSNLMLLKQNERWDVPVEMRCVNRTHEEWKALQQALVHERVMVRLGEAIDPEVAVLLARVRSDGAYLAVEARLATDAGRVRREFERLAGFRLQSGTKRLRRRRLPAQKCGVVHMQGMTWNRASNRHQANPICVDPRRCGTRCSGATKHSPACRRDVARQAHGSVQSAVEYRSRV
eukprot:TRINITY_DN42268_c0_g1_i4.p1 TRINITY_DN42268_c0_g1~~TRINITY_DN42268_c0_g1_i4.p1  ORF type:complete len:332 (-),score=34.81 TRINITY_DN42268_c0_g1_i4:114-1109(-)